MRFRDGCVLCFAGTGHPVPHPGDHLVRQVHGGRASCPLDEADDQDLLLELLFVATEEALQDAERDLLAEVDVMMQLSLCRTALSGAGWHHGGDLFEWEVRSDGHLEDGFGTLDVLCRIIGPLEPEPVAA